VEGSNLPLSVITILDTDEKLKASPLYIFSGEKLLCENIILKCNYFIPSGNNIFLANNKLSLVNQSYFVI
jgi:hypothetical protein